MVLGLPVQVVAVVVACCLVYLAVGETVKLLRLVLNSTLETLQLLCMSGQLTWRLHKVMVFR